MRPFLQNVYVVFDLPFALQLRDQTAVPEMYVHGTPPAGISFVRKMNTQSNVQAIGLLEGGDPYGRISYTGVQVRFNAEPSPEVIGWDDDLLLRESVDRVNQLLDHYRDIFNAPLVRPVSLLHLVHFDVIEGSGDGDPIRRTLLRGAGPLRVGTHADDIELEEALRGRLQLVDPPAVLRLIELDVYARISAGEYRLAVIDAEALFEAWLGSALRAAFVQRGEAEPDVERRFVNGKGSPLGIKDIATKVVAAVIGDHTWSQSPQFRAWDNVRILRNDLLHGHRFTVSEAQAIAAADDVARAIGFLRSMLG